MVKMLDNSVPSGNVKVVYQFGDTVYCKRTDLPPTDSSLSQKVNVLLYSAGGITLLADVVDVPDCFKAVRIFANDRLSMKYLKWRPERREDGVIPEKLEILFSHDEAGEDSVSFAVDCGKCEGNGTIECPKCNGTGVHKPKATCPKCHGKGEVTCRKCNGSGDHYSAKGHRYNCNACEGTGTWACNVCDSQGYFPEKSCFSCNGNGAVDCFACDAARYWKVHDQFGYKFKRYQEEFLPEQVFLYDWKRAQKLVEKGARRFLNIISDRDGAILSDRKKREELCREFLTAKTCLERSMEAEGKLVDTQPFRLGKRQATTERQKGHVIYEFSLINRNRHKWMKDKIFPFPQGSQIKLAPTPEFADAEIKVNAARQAEEELEQFRREYESEKNSIDKDAKKKHADSSTQRSSLTEKSKARFEEAKKRYDADSKTLATEKIRLEKNLTSQTERGQTLRKHLNKSPSIEKRQVSSRTLFRRFIDSCLPDAIHGWTRNTEELIARIQENDTTITQTKKLLRLNNENFDQINRTFTDEESLYIQTINNADIEYEERRENINEEHAARRIALDERLHQEEMPRLAIIQTGEESVLSIGLEFGNVIGATRWLPLAKSVAEKLAVLHTHLSLHAAWQVESTSEASALSLYFDDRLQVVFSACVGIASCKNFDCAVGLPPQ